MGQPDDAGETTGIGSAITSSAAPAVLRALSSPARKRGHRSLIGGAIFSAGAGGSAGFAPSFCACALGSAGSGAGVVGRTPPGFDSAGLLFDSGVGDGGDGCVA